jgi:1-deoxy-D-xylulose-5-phosphate synthase
LDVALHNLPVTFALDRAGITGDDGASHNGMWDLSILQVVPGLRIAAPRDGSRLRELLREAVDTSDGPTCVRFPKGPVPDDIDPLVRSGGMDVLAKGDTDDVLLVAVGPMAGECVAAARRLADHGVGVTVVDPRWVKPLEPELAAWASRHRLVAVVEDCGAAGAVGDAVGRLLRHHRVATPLRTFGLPQRFLPHAKRAQLLLDAGLGAADIAEEICASLAGAPDRLVEVG